MPKSENRSAVTELIQADEGPGWIVTYADLATNLLVFFVLLFSISSLDLQKFRQIVNSFKESFGAPTAVIELVAPDQDRAPQTDNEDKKRAEVPLETMNELEAKARENVTEAVKEELRKEVREEVRLELLEELDQKLVSDVDDFIEKIPKGQHIVVKKERGRITITIEGQILFESGRAELIPQALPILDDIALIVLKYPDYRINIKGHTDDRPIATVQFPSNWELSAVRATTVLRYMATQGVDPKRLTATGYAELLPLAANDTPENQARNRRVEFVLEKETQSR
jgi:chemotaxis protein MotB